VDFANYQLLKENVLPNQDTTPSHEEYKAALSDALFEGRQKQTRILLTKPINEYPQTPDSPIRVLHDSIATSPITRSKSRYLRQIPQHPERILDAPELVDDYYLNLLDWSRTNIVAIALNRTVYLWNAETGTSTELMHTAEEGNIITSLSFGANGHTLALGTNEAQIQIWDVERAKLVRSMSGHSARVGSLDWNRHTLSSGSRDASIINHDVRMGHAQTSILQGHQQEVCGLKWSPDGTFLASGGNDNLLNLWDAHGTTPRFTFDHHEAAVKALAWCPWQPNLLASGGGTADRHIRFWNTSTGTCVNSVDTKSQVCAIQWSKHYKELVSSHGYSQNQLIVWKYPSMTKIAELKRHTSRVLHLAMSPDGKTVASAAGDESLCFWKVFDTQQSSDKGRSMSSSPSALSSGMILR